LGTLKKFPGIGIIPELNFRKVALNPPLKLKQDKSGKFFAQYQMQTGDTLYSSVVIRFTGRLLNDEVNQIANQLLKLNNISKARLIQNHQKIKIPLELLSEEYIESHKNGNLLRKISSKLSNADTIKTQKDNTLKSVADAKKDKKIKKKQNKISKKSNLSVKKNVHKIHVILDSGHGGGDPGAIAGSRKNKDLIYEDEVVYDISRRATELLKKNGIVVHNTLADPNQTKPIKFLSHKHDKDEQLLVTPRYLNRNARTAANMRV
jgi:N-acetylmuramoyl-L-alanine amidase